MNEQFTDYLEDEQEHFKETDLSEDSINAIISEMFGGEDDVLR